MRQLPHSTRTARARALAPLIAAALAACASAGQPRAYVAPTDRTVTTSVAEAAGPRPAQVIEVVNASTVPVTVYSVTLHECQNIRQSCDMPRKLNLRVRPGGREQLLRVEPRDAQGAFGFHYSFGWRADSTSVAALSTMAEGGSTEARQRLDAIERARAEQAAAVGQHDEELGREQIEVLGAEVTALRVEPDTLVLAPREFATFRQFHLILIGAGGQPLGRVREWRIRVQGGPVTVIPPDTIVAVRSGRTRAELALPEGVLASRGAPLGAATLTIVVRDTASVGPAPAVAGDPAGKPARPARTPAAKP